jgi:hypothetical protein
LAILCEISGSDISDEELALLFEIMQRSDVQCRLPAQFQNALAFNSTRKPSFSVPTDTGSQASALPYNYGTSGRSDDQEDASIGTDF